MKAILHQIVFVVATAAMGAACFGADTLPPPNQSAPTPVGDLGREEALVIEGNQTFSKDQILGGMISEIEYHLAAHPAAPLADYLARLERMITLGYQHAGFPSVKAKAVAETNAGRVVVRVNEGPRFHCGEILLSGAKTMTNEVVRQKIADVLGGLEIATGSPSNLASTAWLANQPATLDEFSRESLTKRVQEALAVLNYYQPKVSVKIVPDPARKLADLKIEIADEGIKGTVVEIEVSGLYTNTRPQLLEYLKLKPGMEVDATLVAATTNRLWRSARFFRHDVSLVPLASPGQFKLTLDLDEVREAPPLTGEFSPKESALLKFRDWLSGWETRPEDMVVSISFSNSSLRGNLNLVLSPSGMALTVHDTTSNSPTRLQYALVASEKLIGLYSVWRRSKFTMPRDKDLGFVLLKVTPRSPKSYGDGNISFVVGMNAVSTQPFRLELVLQPAVFLSMAHWMDSSLKDGVITLTQPSEDGSWEFRINAATGRLLQATAGSLGSDGLVTELHPEEGALARMFKGIAAATVDHTNCYARNRGFSSWAAFTTEEVVESPLIGHAFDEFSRDVAENDGRTDPTEGSRQIKTALVLLRQLLGQQNLAAVFEPLNRIFAANPEEEDDDEENFIVPTGKSPGDAMANPMAGIGAWVLGTSDKWLPRHSWPWVLLRESAFTAVGQAKYTQTELDKLLKSEAIGPAGCLATAYLLGRINPRLARTFAERGLTRLNPAEFHQDYRLLLRTNSIVGDLASNALSLLKGLGESRLTMLAAGLGPDEAAFVRDLTRLLLDAKGQPPSDAAWPAFEQHWDKVSRRYLEVGLNRFLPRVHHLTDSQALYERGLMLISPDSAFQDFDEAAQCFRKAADQGHAGAQLQFGLLCQSGQGVREDFTAAMRWYRKAADQKEPHATCQIAVLYHEGIGVPQDLDEAAKWYRLEADGNCARSQFNLGRILEAKLDTDAAVKWYRRAAEGGVTAAQAKLGDLLSDGLFAKPDYVEACQWLSLAATAGDKFSEIRFRRLKAKLTLEQIMDAEKRADAVTKRLEQINKEQKEKAAKAKK